MPGMGFQTPAYAKLLDGWKERKSRMLKMRSDGRSDDEIAKEIGVSRARVWQIIGPSGKRLRESA